MQSVHDFNGDKPIHKQHISIYHERGPIHSRVPSYHVSKNENTFYITGGFRHGVEHQRPLHAPHLHVHHSHPSKWKTQLQHRVARQRRLARSDGLHSLLLRLGIRHPASFDFCILLLSHKEIEDGGSKEQIQGEEEIASKSDEAGSDRDHRLRDVLAAVLGVPGGADILPAQRVRVPRHHHRGPHRRLLQLLQLSHEPHPVRLPVGQLQEELLEGLHVRSGEGRKRHSAHGKQRVSPQEGWGLRRGSRGRSEERCGRRGYCAGVPL